MAVALPRLAVLNVGARTAALAGAVTALPEPDNAAGAGGAAWSPAVDDVAAGIEDAPVLSTGTVAIASPMPVVPDGTAID